MVFLCSMLNFFTTFALESRFRVLEYLVKNKLRVLEHLVKTSVSLYFNHVKNKTNK